jgi:hypothetical protein
MDNLPTTWPVPANMRVAESPSSLTITHLWSRVKGYVLLVFGIIWNGGLYFNLKGAIAAEGLGGSILPMSPFIAIGVVVVYAGLSFAFNSTIITITFEQLTIKHAPLPWFGNRLIARGDLKQPYVKQHKLRDENNTSYIYSVNVIDGNQKDITLVGNLSKAEEAKFIEQKIEQYLKLKDQPVPGEWKG